MDLENKLSDAISHLNDNENSNFQDIINDVLAFKANEKIDDIKYSIASTMFNAEDEE